MYNTTPNQCCYNLENHRLDSGDKFCSFFFFPHKSSIKDVSSLLQGTLGVFS